MMMGIKNAVFFDDVRVPAFHLIGGENRGWIVGNTHLELEHGGAGSISDDSVMERLVDYCLETRRGGKLLIHDAHVRELLADALIESHVGRLLAMRNYWYRINRKPHPYGGPQYRFYDRILRLNNARRLQQIIGYESLVPDLRVNEMDDFEHLTRAGPGQLHGGGTMDTDRLILARRMGLGRSVKEVAPTTI
jgi:cyclohexanecarboxyl-CoA dehydrogenase